MAADKAQPRPKLHWLSSTQHSYSTALSEGPGPEAGCLRSCEFSWDAETFDFSAFACARPPCRTCIPTRRAEFARVALSTNQAQFFKGDAFGSTLYSRPCQILLDAAIHCRRFPKDARNTE